MSETRLLQLELQDRSLHALLLAVQKALSRSGYGDVQFLGRRRPRQKSRFGGHDLVCETVMGPNLHRTVVKVLRDSVRTRHLDELAGAVIRTGADSGIVVSPFPQTKEVARHLGSGRAARVHVVAGADMAEWFAGFGVGTTKDGRLDRQYFLDLEVAAEQVEEFLAKEGV
ncbi:MAG: restriction endonuclease [Armatimonadetes bacterium]|nr:restriction endonuclease [Armatimonadota bacterium]